MFAVVFEVHPKPEHWQDYLALAGALRPELEKIDGFIANERFTSRGREGWVLSLSIWRDEKAVIRWRTRARHHDAQERGRSQIFEDYHLRVGEVVADSGFPSGHSLPQQRFDETETGRAKLVTISELDDDGPKTVDFAAALGLPKAGAGAVIDYQTFAGINDPKRLLLLASWKDAGAASGWRPAERAADLRHRAVRIIRDYAMRDRREAPQYYPEVAPLRGPT